MFGARSSPAGPGPAGAGQVGPDFFFYLFFIIFYFFYFFIFFLFFFSIFNFCLLTFAIALLQGCRENWKYFEETIDGPACYLVKRNYFNWYGARDDCLQNFADLVSITTLPEQEFITDELLQGNYMWLGISDENTEGTWTWSDKYVRVLGLIAPF